MKENKVIMSYLDIPTKGRHDSALKFPIYSGAKVASWIR